MHISLSLFLSIFIYVSISMYLYRVKGLTREPGSKICQTEDEH